MATIISEGGPPGVIAQDVAVQLLSVASVLTEFAKITLSGSSHGRLKTAMDLLVATPATNHIVDENGDVMVISFTTLSAAAPYRFIWTREGLKRRELENGFSQGF